MFAIAVIGAFCGDRPSRAQSGRMFLKEMTSAPFIQRSATSAPRRLGLLFVDFEGQDRMRINGTAEIIDDHPAYNGVRAAQLAVRVKITDIHPNCPRNVHKMTLVEQSRYTPKCVADDVGKAPWGDDFGDVLPESMKPEGMK